MNIADNLNLAQKKSVQFGTGPLLIVAGAGTGKTTVITQRIAWLIMDKKVGTDNILALTFTDKAAGEMEERVDVLLPYGYVDLWISTFHAFCERILKDNALEIGLAPDFKLLNQTAQILLVQQNLEAFDLDYYRPLGNPTKFIQALVKHFSRAKDEDVLPSDYLEYAKKLQLDRDDDKFLKKMGSEDEGVSEDKRIMEVANAYHVYQQLLLDNSALDFGDLILYTIKLFKTRPQILEKYRQQFQYILVDEFQDTNYAQYELVKLLAAPQNNLTVVGDDDQCLPGTARIQLDKGTRRIDAVRVGDRVLTGVGKGHVSISTVNKVFKNRKKTKFFTFVTSSGRKITVTTNHKMFCYIPLKPVKLDWHYVYLMHRQNLGWRIGVTNDLSTRLRLERSADKIIGIGAYTTDQEARYWESFYALKYGIPSVCFQNRDGVAISGEWLEKLYREIDSEGAVRKLARDLSIDLEAHHYSLQGVVRGGKSRVKIYLDINYRKYRSKEHVRKGRFVIHRPSISHLVSLETSEKNIIAKIKGAGVPVIKVMKGWRVRIQTNDIRKAGALALKLKELTSGILENRFTVGRINYQHRPALVMPAANVLPGHYLPVKRGRNIEYERVEKVSVAEKEMTVYDLEIDRTHNFIANNIVVHNSIYKFRGAAISNILEFKKDFPDSQEIVLTDNYRSAQNILDLSYSFIKQNDPNRLEYQLSKGKVDPKGAPLKTAVSKKLKSFTKEEGIIQHLHFMSHIEEASGVAKKIIELKKQNKQLLWSDFAILVRANAYAHDFMSALNRYDLPYQFLASAGLYSQPEIMDVIAYLKMLDNYHESASLWRVLNLPQWHLPAQDLMVLSNYASRKSISLYETLLKARTIQGISEKMNGAIDKILKLVHNHSQLAKTKSVLPIALRFMENSGYLKHLTKEDSPENLDKIVHLNQFFRKIEEFESGNDDKSVKNFLTELNEAQEAGEEGSMSQPWEEGPEAVKIMTIHGAKGLEFPYVFLVNLVDKRMPTVERKEPIELPEVLVKEIIPEGDIHLQEERRLFYVGMTRAKDGLFFTSADDYGGTRKKKPSRFLVELGFERREGTEELDMTDRLRPPAGAPKSEADVNFLQKAVPERASFTQVKAFETCPKQFKYAHIWRVPVEGRHTFSFGKSMHNTLYQFFKRVQEGGTKQQADLFGATKGKSAPQLRSGPLASQRVSLEELWEIYGQEWIDDWYLSKQHAEEYFQKGKEALEAFYESHQGNFPIPLFLEREFVIKLEQYPFKGVIDRIDPVGARSTSHLARSESPETTRHAPRATSQGATSQEVEIIDYKTGQLPKSGKLEAGDKEQLQIYNLACREVLKLKPVTLSYYYLEANKKLSFEADENLEPIKKRLLETIKNIRASDFKATPGFWCQSCDFREICEDRWRG